MSDLLRTISLEGIEFHCDTLRYAARTMSTYVMRLTHQPPYETKAGAAIEDAEKALAEALESVREMKTVYQGLSVREKNDV